MTGIKEYTGPCVDAHYRGDGALRTRFHYGDHPIGTVVREAAAEARRSNAAFPEITMRRGRGDHGSGFSLHLADGKAVVTADSPCDAAFGAMRYIVECKAGSGVREQTWQSPRFSDRWLWLGGSCAVSLAEGLRCAIPSSIQGELADPGTAIDTLCRKVLELGWSGVIFGARADCPVSETAEECHKLGPLIARCHAYGLKVAVRPTVLRSHASESQCPANRDYYDRIVATIRGWLWDPSADESHRPDHILWESCCRSRQYTLDSAAEGQLHHDLLAAELQMIETATAGKLGTLFLVPWVSRIPAERQVDALMRVGDLAGPKTQLSFTGALPATDSERDSLHPIWAAMQCREAVPATPLLPTVNLGGIGCGEGLWPCTYLETLERLLPIMSRSPSAGVIALTNALPDQDAFLGASLWSAAQALWDGVSPSLHVETWLRAWRPNWGAIERDVVAIAGRLGRYARLVHGVDSASLRELAELIFAECRYLQRNGVATDSEMRAMTAPFVRDVRRNVMAAAQAVSLPLGNVAASDDSGFGFWTAMRQGAEGGVASGGNVVVLSAPRPARDDAILEKVFAKRAES